MFQTLKRAARPGRLHTLWLLLALGLALPACRQPTPTPAPVFTPEPGPPVQIIPPPATAAPPSPAPAIPQPNDAAPEPEANARAPGNWSSGSRQGMGTAFTYATPGDQVNPSRVWFALDDGAVTDLFWPRLDQANFHSLRFLVSDGKTFLHDLWRDATVQTERPWPRLPFWRVVMRDKAQRYRLTLETATASNADGVLLRARFEALQGQPGDYQVYLYVLPHLANSGRNDVVEVNLSEGMAIFGDTVDTGLTGHAAFAALTGDIPWITASAGYVRNSDGLTDLADFRLDTAYAQAGAQGRPALTIWLTPASEWLLAVGFGPNAATARTQAVATIAPGWEATAQSYLAGWQGYVDGLAQFDAPAPDLFYLSACLIKAHEDKTMRGAIIASSAVPWGDRTPDGVEQGGYRRVWARDLYHAASGLLAAGDTTTAPAVLAFLDDVQQRPTGAFPQNSYVDGRPYWTGTQMDQAAAPILLAWRLDAVERYDSLVEPAANFIEHSGPFTPQERWEELGGYSPASLAAQVAALTAAADLARRAGDDASAARWQATADAWQAQIKTWTFTTNGPLGDGRYFLRLASRGGPGAAPQRANEATTIRIGGQLVDQRTIVDASFLELVRLGVLAPQDESILATLPKVDASLRVETPFGPSWRRYPGDRYGEESRSSLALGQGRPWPLLTGERGVYAVAAGERAQAEALWQALGRFSNEGGLLSEQVWEDDGQGTGSATPLVWAHAEYLVLWRSWHDNTVHDLPQVTAARYAGKTLKASETLRAWGFRPELVP